MSVPLPIIIDMGDVIPQTLRALAGDQAGVVTRQQALGAGMSDGAIVARIKFGRWQRVHSGVYATFTGPLTRDAQLWAAVLAAGPGAQLSHQTAAEINRLTDHPSPFIHVTIPANRRITPPNGVIIHLSSNLTFGWRFARGVPPYTFAEETVVDLVHAATNLNDVIACVTGGFAKRKVSEATAQGNSDRKEEAPLARRPRRDHPGRRGRRALRHRVPLRPRRGASARTAQGRQAGQIHQARRQLGIPRPVLRGVQAHRRARRKAVPPARAPGPATRIRDNDAAATVGSTLRYGWVDVTSKRCDSARQLHAALTSRGYAGPLKPCSPVCAVITTAAGRRVSASTR